MKIENPEHRLKQFWGKVDDKHVNSIAKHITGHKVLDVGCGMGSTTFKLNQLFGNTKTVIGIDYESSEIEKAKRYYPNCDFQVDNCEDLSFEDDTFDTIILRDALHHLYEENDFEKIKKEMLRVLKPNGRIITLDPNVNWWMRFLRKLSKHEDAECDFNTALKIFSRDLNMKIEKTNFHTVFSLPLSGGYVGFNFVPNNKLIWSFILGLESVFESVFNVFRIGKFTTWRYLIVAEA